MELIIIFVVVIVLLFFVLFVLLKKVKSLEKLVADLEFAKSSQAVKHGKTTEQLMPFAKDFPFDSESFRFIGSPVDGVAFTKNEIFFVEFKTGASKLSEKQQNVKKLVLEKKVSWLEIKK